MPSSAHRVLVVDDDRAVACAVSRMVARLGHDAVTAPCGEDALRILHEQEIDLVISDLLMPGLDGIGLLRELRARDLEIPVVFLTGAPSVDSATRAVEYGAFRYLTKPVEPYALARALDDAARARSIEPARAFFGDHSSLDESLRSALDGMWMAFQPIVSVDTRRAMGYEALLRSREPSLPHPGAVIDAAEKLDAVHVLGRRTRALTAEAISRGPAGATYFVNVHPADLADPDLYDFEAPLTRHARHVVIEITERSALEGAGELERRIGELRRLGFRIAVDDLGAGYAGLGYLATLQPEIVKIDMSLVRGIDSNPVKQRVVLSITEVSRWLGIEVIGEGVETAAERDVLARLGCTHLQGFLFARPAAPFPSATWAPS